MASKKTYIDELEYIAEEVSTWAADLVDSIVSTLAPDGRPFGQSKLTEQEQIRDYLSIRGDSNKWSQMLEERVQEILKNISTLPPDIQASVHPYDIAVKDLITYSSHMESLLTEKLLPDEKGKLSAKG